MRANLFTKVLLILCLIPFRGVAAATVWTSPITNSVTWTKADSPHTWSGNMTVSAGGVINIEAGAVVQMPPGNNLTLGAGSQILALGSSDDPIRFGGVSDTAKGGTVYINSSLTSQFRHCQFANLSQINITAQSPQGNHLFEYCVFRKFIAHVVQLSDAPARILHCIFRDNASDQYAVYMAITSFSDETCPTIWYNTIDRNGLLATAPNYGTASFNNHDFFRYNRVAGGTGIFFAGDRYPSFTGFLLRDCDLGNASPSLNLSASPGWDGGLAGSILGCNLSTLTRSSFGVGGVTNLTNNYWGTTNIETIASALFGGAISTNVAIPISTTNVFPQADVDGSDNGNRTLQADADLVKKAVVGLVTLSPAQQAIADVDRNGTVDARDALLIESYINNLIWKLPVP